MRNCEYITRFHTQHHYVDHFKESMHYSMSLMGMSINEGKALAAWHKLACGANEGTWMHPRHNQPMPQFL